MKKALLLTAGLLAAATGHTQRQRLMARLSFEDTSSNGCCPLLDDSTVFQYSGNRGSHFDYSILDYFDPRSIVDGSYIMRQSTIVRPNNIDSTGCAVTTQFDTMRFFTFSTYYGKVQERSETCEYNPDGTPSLLTSNYTPLGPDSSFYRYIAEYRYYSGILTGGTYSFESSTDVRRIEQQRLIMYDMDGNPFIDSVTYASPTTFNSSGHALHYDYNAGRYISARGGYWRGGFILVEPLAFTYEYYPDGHVKTRKEFFINSYGQLRPSSLDTFGYTPGVEGYTMHRLYSLNSSGTPPYLYYEYTCHLNTAGLRDTVVENHSQGWDREVSVLSYNSYGNPVLKKMYGIRQDSSVIQRGFIRYDYETYAPLAVAAASPDIALRVAPNPTNGIVHLLYEGAAEQAVRVCVTDALGRQVYTGDLILRGGGASFTLAGGLAAGAYTVVVCGKNGEVVCIQRNSWLYLEPVVSTAVYPVFRLLHPPGAHRVHMRIVFFLLVKFPAP